jgi:RNA polymerase sigma-70 factor, ECF subfamily
MEFETRSDEGLMKRVRKGDVDAFRVLYDSYAGRIYTFTLRHCGNRAMAEDMLQETFWRVWQGARTFEPARGEFCRWVYRIALNVVRNEFCHRRHTLECALESAGAAGIQTAERESSASPALEVERRRSFTQVAAALDALSPAMRDVVVLRCLEGLKFQEIAAATGTPQGTLKARFHRAVRDLRRLLSPGESE